MTQPSIAVIGGGPGGYVFAIEAARFGATVTLFEDQGLGGVCLRAGCVPSKTFAAAADALDASTARTALGISNGDARLDIEALKKTKRRLVQTLGKGIEALLSSAGAEVVPAVAEVSAGGRSVIAAGATHSPSHAVIATGSRRAATPGYSEATAAEDVFELEQLPASVAVIGTGYIAVELASFFAAAGSDTTLVVDGPILDAEDVDIRRAIEASFARRKVTVAAEPAEDVELLIDASERVPNPPPLDGLRMDGQAVAVDSVGRTSLERVYAVGDVTGGFMLAGVAYAQARAAARHVVQGRTTGADLRAVPRAIFSLPEVGTVGLSEQDAKASGHRVSIGRFPLSANCRARLLGGSGGEAKVVSDTDTGRILGVHLIGPGASDLIANAAALVSFEATVEDVSALIHVHPTLAEAPWEAALVAGGEPLHIPDPNKKHRKGADDAVRLGTTTN